MLTIQYNRTVPFNVSVAEAATDIMRLLVKRQVAIARIDYELHLKPLSKRNAQSHAGPHLMDRLASMQPKIDHTDNELRIELSYPATIRFLDLKKIKSGNKKRRYTAIYNRPLFGHLYGRGYSLSSMVNLALQQQYRNYFSILQDVMKTIDLL